LSPSSFHFNLKTTIINLLYRSHNTSYNHLSILAVIMNANDSRPALHPPLIDLVDEVQPKFSFRYNIYKDIYNLLPHRVKTHISFKTSEHISHIVIAFAK
jgi:hypothetical protein